MNGGRFDADAAREFLDLYDGLPEFLWIGTFDPTRGRSFATDEAGLDAAVDYAARLDESAPTGVYWRTSTLSARSTADRRGSESDTERLPFLFADIDYGIEGHKPSPDGRPNPPDAVAAHRLIAEAELPDPTMIIMSGGGLYPLWKVDDGANLDDAADALRGVQHALARAADSHGWHYGDVGDLARVLRLPGSVNRKTDNHRACEVVEKLGGLYIPADFPKPTMPRREPPRTPAGASGGTGAFDALSSSASWADLLQPAGWTFVRTERAGSELWLRPGDASSSYSARCGYNGVPTMVCHSTSAGLPSGAGQRLTAGRVFANLHHGGDESAAGSDLVAAAHDTGGSQAAKALPGSVLAAIRDVTRAPGSGQESATDEQSEGEGRDDEGDQSEPSDAKTSWSPIDLGPYINGTITRPEPSVGAQRRDGLRFFYPGLEHAVIGQTEGGKTWFLLASAAAELMAGNMVVYIHFEENDPGSTVSRLLRQFRVPADRILEDFKFLGPEYPVYPGRIDELCTERAPTYVVLDGVNEAMALHAQKINDPDGSAEFRRRLVKPWTRHGAAVAAADHVVKDTNVNGSGYALGSVHKVNALSGAGFLIENREAFGEGLRGNSGVYVVKDRPGVLRKAGRPTNVARKYHLAEMSIDDTGAEWQFELHVPHPAEGGPELLDPNDWRGPDQPLPPSDVLAYEGPGCKAIRELAQFMRARATGGGAMSLSDATRALVSVKSASGEPLHRRDTVKRAWQALHETLSRLQLANPNSGPNAESCWIARDGDPK